MKTLLTLFLVTFSQLILASRVTIELTDRLELRQEDQNGHLELVIELPKGSIISYRENREVEPREYIDSNGEIVLSTNNWFRSILVYSTPLNISESEIDRINELPLFISKRVLSIAKQNKYNVDQEERAKLARKVIDNCRYKELPVEVLTIAGEKYEVTKDNAAKLKDGAYIPMTVPEAKDLARSCGFRLPTEGELKAISREAFNNGNQFKAITRTKNDNSYTQLLSTNRVLNDPLMMIRSNKGEKVLIDGHFKWYDNKGRIYGFAKSANKYSFYHSRASGAHVSRNDYYDYSHGVRLIRKLK